MPCEAPPLSVLVPAQIRAAVAALASQAQVAVLAEAQKDVSAATARLIIDLRDLQAQVLGLGSHVSSNSASQGQLGAQLEGLSQKVSEHAGGASRLAGELEALQGRVEKDLALRVQQGAEALSTVSVSKG